MFETRNLAILAERELRDAWRNRWFLLFGGAFTALALGLSWLSVSGVAGSPFAGFARTAASLVNLVLLVVPLVGLTLGAGAVAGERERGSLLYVVSQPVEPREVVLGKFLGLSVAILAALLLGFGLAGLVMSWRGISGTLGPYLGFLGLAALLGMAALSCGLLVSTLSTRVSVAAGVGLFLWLVFVFVGDLGLMGTALALRLEPGELLAVALANPLQVFKVASLVLLRGGLEVLGPAGLLAQRTWGAGLVPLLVGILGLWTLAPLVTAAVVLERRGGVG